jgi:hypothetical protein
MEEWFQLSFQVLADYLLGDTVKKGRHSQFADTAVFLGYFHPLDRYGKITPRGQSVP